TPLCDTATVSVTVRPLNDPPVAENDTAATDEDTPVLINVLENDSDPDGNLDATSVSVISGPSHGSTEVNPLTGEITYTPATDYVGTDSFTYQVCDTNEVCTTAVVNLSVALLGRIEGTIWDDADGNGTLGGSEAGID